MSITLAAGPIICTASENSLFFDFENGDMGAVKVIGADDVKEIVTDPKNPENHVLYMETGEGDEWFQSHSGFTIGSDSKFYGKTLIDLDLMIPSDTNVFNEGFSLYFRNESTGEYIESYRQIQISSERIAFMSSAGQAKIVDSSKGFSADEWHNLKLLADTKEFTIDVFYDNNFIVKMPIWGAGTASKNVDFLFSFAVKLTGKGAKLYLDNVKIEQIDKLSLISSSPENKSENVNVGDPINLVFNNEIKESNLVLDSAEPLPLLKDNSSYYVKPNLLWDKEYNVSGTVTDIFDQTAEINLSFKTRRQPDSYVILQGFYDEADNKLEELKKGIVKAKLDFWQKADTHYTLIAGLYSKKDGIIEMLNVNAVSVQSGDEILKSECIELDVPDTDDDYFVNIMVWNNLKEGIPLNEGFYSGISQLGRR